MAGRPLQPRGDSSAIGPRRNSLPVGRNPFSKYAEPEWREHAEYIRRWGVFSGRVLDARIRRRLQRPRRDFKKVGSSQYRCRFWCDAHGKPHCVGVVTNDALITTRDEVSYPDHNGAVFAHCDWCGPEVHGLWRLEMPLVRRAVKGVRRKGGPIRLADVGSRVVDDSTNHLR